MFKKAGNYEKARKLFSEMAARGVPQSTITYNSLMSFETNYKEVSRIYDQVNLYGLVFTRHCFHMGESSRNFRCRILSLNNSLMNGAV